MGSKSSGPTVGTPAEAPVGPSAMRRFVSQEPTLTVGQRVKDCWTGRIGVVLEILLPTGEELYTYALVRWETPGKQWTGDLIPVPD